MEKSQEMIREHAEELKEKIAQAEEEIAAATYVFNKSIKVSSGPLLHLLDSGEKHV